MDKYKKKQLIICLVYLIIFLIIVAVVYSLAKTHLPNCNDKIQNQGEEGIDCGGPCAPCPWQLQKDLEVISTQAIKTQENYVDLVAKVKNPNPDFGAKSFSYVFNLYDARDSLILSKEGSSYILPSEVRYIIEQRVLIDSEVSKSDLVSRVEFKVINIDWQELVDYQEPELLIRKYDFKQSEDASRLAATLENKSNYDFGTVDVWAILFDEDFKVLGAGRIELKTILSKENRYFEISWAFPIEGQVSRTDIIAKTNVFLDENFMRRYGGERERFQEY